MIQPSYLISLLMHVSLRVTCAPVCLLSMLRFSAAIFLAHPRARANGRCLKSLVVPSDGGRYSSATSTAPQDYPLNTNVPTGKEANYPFKLDALTISIIGVNRSQTGKACLCSLLSTCRTLLSLHILLSCSTMQLWRCSCMLPS